MRVSQRPRNVLFLTRRSRYAKANERSTVSRAERYSRPRPPTYPLASFIIFFLLWRDLLPPLARGTCLTPSSIILIVRNQTDLPKTHRDEFPKDTVSVCEFVWSQLPRPTLIYATV